MWNPLSRYSNEVVVCDIQTMDIVPVAMFHPAWNSELERRHTWRMYVRDNEPSKRLSFFIYKAQPPLSIPCIGRPDGRIFHVLRDSESTQLQWPCTRKLGFQIIQLKQCILACLMIFVDFCPTKHGNLLGNLCLSVYLSIYLQSFVGLWMIF
jgi:hypothetical protein